MLVSGQERHPKIRTDDKARADKAQADRGPRARMRKIMLDAAMRLMQDGLIPSVSDVAEAAQVSRATAYRYFPSQSALIQAAVDEALGPILAWTSDSTDAEDRVTELVTFAYPRMESYEATLKAALRLALDQWARRHAGLFGDEAPMVRGHRIGLLNSAVSPLKGKLGLTGIRTADAIALAGVRNRSLRRAEGYLGPGPQACRGGGAVDVPRVDPGGGCRRWQGRGAGSGGRRKKEKWGARISRVVEKEDPDKGKVETAVCLEHGDKTVAGFGVEERPAVCNAGRMAAKQKTNTEE